MINNPANSLEFWQKVKAEFEQSTKEIYICHGSNIFAEWWGKPYFRKKCQLFAKLFLAESGNKSHTISANCVKQGALFVRITLHAYDDRQIHRQVRLDFINWCINKFQ